MGDDFRHWRLRDIARANAVIGAITAWLGDLRHSATEALENEEARTRGLSEALLRFNNERLAAPGQAGTIWVPRQSPLTLLDRLTVVEGAFIDGVLAKAIPAWGSGVTRRVMDGKYWLPSQRDAWRIIEWSQVNTIPWQREQYDCDDHAEALRHDFRSFGVNSCGVVVDYSGGHAYDVLIFADGQYWFLEPQQDKIVAIGAGIYKLANGYISL